jgi:hypothetical protein
LHSVAPTILVCECAGKFGLRHPSILAFPCHFLLTTLPVRVKDPGNTRNCQSENHPICRIHEIGFANRRWTRMNADEWMAFILGESPD